MKKVKLIIISFIFALLVIPMSVNAEEEPYCLLKVSDSSDSTMILHWDCEDLSQVSDFTVYEVDSKGNLNKMETHHPGTPKNGTWEIPSKKGNKFEIGKNYVIGVKLKRWINKNMTKSVKKVHEIKISSFDPTKKSDLHPNTTTRVTRKITGTAETNTTEKNSVETTATVSASIKSNNNFICDEGDTLGKKDENGEDILTFRGLLKKYWSWVLILVPAALLVFISYDFIKSMASNDSDALKKSSTNALKRVIAGLLILLAPWFVQLIMGWFGLTFCLY